MTDDSPAPADPYAIQRVRHETRMRLLEVIAVDDITPLMRRFTLRGDLTGFASPGYSDHIKAFFFPAGTAPQIAPIGPNGAEWPEGMRPQMRDYTPRSYDLAAGTIVLDFVLHGDGPASSWAATAKIGDLLVIGGPRGSQVVPMTFDWYVLAGDETALPAIGRRIEELPAGAKVTAIIEVADAAEEQSFETNADLDLRYVHRNGAPAGTTRRIEDALADWIPPQGEGFIFVAGESTMSKAVKANLIATKGCNPERIKAAGYWLLGVADAHEPH